jgi:hypothetical protein
MHQLRMSSLRPFSGWTKIPSSLPDFFFFFPPLLYPKIFPRPTYHLPSLHRQSSRDLGRLWSGSWSCGYGAGAAGAGAELLELERDPRAHEKVRSLACLLVATQQVPERESLLLQHSKLRSLLQLNPAMQQALERLLQ